MASLVEYKINGGLAGAEAFLLLGHGRKQQPRRSSGIVCSLADVSFAGQDVSELFVRLAKNKHETVDIGTVSAFPHLSIKCEQSESSYPHKLDIKASCTCGRCKPPIGNVPRLPANYFHREYIEKRCEHITANLSGGQRAVLWGVPGSGKTLLASQVARSQTISRQYEKVFWFEIDNNADEKANLLCLAGLVDAQRDDGFTNRQLTATICSKLNTNFVEGCLLIVDNVEAESQAELYDFGTPTLLIARQNVAIETKGDVAFELKPLENEEIKNYLQFSFRNVPPGIIGDTDRCAAILNSWTAGHPLLINFGLATVAKTIEQSGTATTVEQILQSLNERQQSVYDPSASEHTKLYMRTFLQAMFNQLRPQVRCCAERLTIFRRDIWSTHGESSSSQYQPPVLPAWSTIFTRGLLRALWIPLLEEQGHNDSWSVDEVIDELVNCGFLQKRPEPMAYTIPTIFADYLEEHSDSSSTTACHDLIVAYLTVTPEALESQQDVKYKNTHLGYHLLQAGRIEEFLNTFVNPTDFGQLRATTETPGNHLFDDINRCRELVPEHEFSDRLKNNYVSVTLEDGRPALYLIYKDRRNDTVAKVLS